MSKVSKKRVKGDAKRAQCLEIFECAMKTRFSKDSEKRQSLFRRGRGVLREFEDKTPVVLPFIKQFAAFPLRLQSSSIIVDGSCLANQEPATVQCIVRSFADGKEHTKFHNWDPKYKHDDDESAKADIALYERMKHKLEKLDDAHHISLEKHCLHHLVVLRKARQQCIAQMLTWDADDVDVDALLAESD